MKELIETLRAKSLDACFAQLRSKDTPLALATVVQAISPTSGKPGDKALVSSDAIVEGWIGGGCAQPAVIEAARSTLESGEAKLIRVGPKGEWEPMQGVDDFTSGCLSGGTLLIFVEPMTRQPLLTVLGNSPAAHHLCNLASHLGFSVTLACPDSVDAELAENVSLVTDFTAVDGDYIVVATQGKHDRDALKAALGTDARHIAMIASAKKIDGLKASFARSGVASTQLDRINSPAGIEIGAVTPAEIALSVLADLVRVRRGVAGLNQTLPSAETKFAEDIAPVATTEGSGGCCGG
ncbi:MAG: XdhC family protein [Gammaproteobacteria bacterium]|nr:XdhC family protein [Gammaproteobacteria bacterium]